MLAAAAFSHDDQVLATLGLNQGSFGPITAELIIDQFQAKESRFRNGNAAYAFGSVSGLPVDMLVGADGALYVLTRDAITRISAP